MDKFIKYINNTKFTKLFYLLSHNNKKNQNYYIIQFSNQKIAINNLTKNEFYSELIQESVDHHSSGYTKK